MHTCEAVDHYFHPFDTRFHGFDVRSETFLSQVHDQVHPVMLSIVSITTDKLECPRWAHIEGHS